MKIILHFISKLGTAEIETENDYCVNLLVGDRVFPYGGWLVPVKKEDEVPDLEDDNYPFFEWEVIGRKWEGDEYDESKPALHIEILGK